MLAETVSKLKSRLLCLIWLYLWGYRMLPGKLEIDIGIFFFFHFNFRFSHKSPKKTHGKTRVYYPRQEHEFSSWHPTVERIKLIPCFRPVFLQQFASQFKVTLNKFYINFSICLIILGACFFYPLSFAAIVIIFTVRHLLLCNLTQDTNLYHLHSLHVLFC